MSEKSFIEKVTEISIRNANYSSEIKAEFNNRVREINTENLITPKWLNPENRGKAIEITLRLESLVNELLDVYKKNTLLMYRELIEIDEDILPERRNEILEGFLKKLNGSSYQVGGFFALSQSQFRLTSELFNFFEQRDEDIFFENFEPKLDGKFPTLRKNISLVNYDVN